MHSLCKVCGATLEDSFSVGQKNGFDLLRCPSCQSLTVSPFPTEEDLVAFYQAYEGTTDYRKKSDKKIRRAKKRISRLMAHSKGKDFLDVGCNYGFAVEAARQLGLHAFGIDIDGKAIESNQSLYGKDLFRACSVQDFAASGRKFDFVYTSEVIEHVMDPASFMQAIASLLKPDGLLYLTTPDAGHFRVKKNPLRWSDVMPPEHIVYFSQSGMRHLLGAAGMDVVKFFFSLKPQLRVMARKRA